MKVAIDTGAELYPQTVISTEGERDFRWASPSDIWEVPKDVVDDWKRARAEWQTAQDEIERWIETHDREGRS